MEPDIPFGNKEALPSDLQNRLSSGCSKETEKERPRPGITFRSGGFTSGDISQTLSRLQEDLALARSQLAVRENESRLLSEQLAAQGQMVVQLRENTERWELRSNSDQKRIQELQAELELRERQLRETAITGQDALGIADQSLKASLEKAERLSRKLKTRTEKNQKLKQELRELRLRQTVVADELRVARTQVADLQAIRRQGTDSLMGEHAERLQILERL